MNILTKNAETTTKYIKALQAIDAKWIKERQRIRNKIAETATSQARLMVEATYDVGNPEQLCEELSKLRLEYTEIIVKEGEEKKKLMNEYMENITAIMGKPKLISEDIIKLGIYEKYIQTQLNLWDLPANVVVWPQNGWHLVHHGQTQNGIMWLNNFRHTINTKIAEATSNK